MVLLLFKVDEFTKIVTGGDLNIPNSLKSYHHFAYNYGYASSNVLAVGKLMGIFWGICRFGYLTIVRHIPSSLTDGAFVARFSEK